MTASKMPPSPHPLEDGSELWVAPYDGAARVIYRHEDPASVDALTHDGELLVSARGQPSRFSSRPPRQ